MRAAVVLASFASLAAAAPPPVRIAPLSAQFFLAEEGSWTKNMLDSKGVFTGWNTGAGEGDIPGPATDAIIVASLSSPGNDVEGVFLPQPVVMTARVGKKVIATRTVKSFFIPRNGRGNLILPLVDIQCAGGIDVTVTYGKLAKKARLNMDCGE